MKRRSPVMQIPALAGWLVAVFLAAGIGALATVDAPAFYAQLQQPSWAPPAAVFGPVWTLLYTLMGVAAWLVWRQGRAARGALWLFGVQLGVNAAWSWLFFAWHKGALAFAWVIALALLVAATMCAFWRVRRAAAVLLAPYLLWVGFAAVLTWALWRGNPGLL